MSGVDEDQVPAGCEVGHEERGGELGAPGDIFEGVVEAAGEFGLIDGVERFMHFIAEFT